MRALALIAILVANYYFTTLSIWFGHWSSHFRVSPTYEFHVGGHHALYPDSKASISRTFLYGTGRHDSLFALLPALIVQGVVLAVFTHSWVRGGLLLEAALIATGVSWVHAQFHTGRTVLNRFQWFRGARKIHFAHHDRDVNFMVADHFWDHVFQTFQSADGLREVPQ
jgi:hypothetical protein